MEIFPITDEIAFWGHQIEEHQAFIYALLVDDQLIRENDLLGLTRGIRPRAEQLENKWRNLLDVLFSNRDIITITLRLIEETLQYQQYIMEVLHRGIFIGWLPYSLVEHMTMETQYLQRKLTGEGYTLESEYKFWLPHHVGETAVLEKQLDPSQKQLARQIREYDEQLESIVNMTAPDLEELIEQKPRHIYNNIKFALNQYDSFGLELLGALATGKVLTITPQTVLDHAIREGQRAQFIFRALLQ